jgi:hypothetical protein
MTINPPRRVRALIYVANVLGAPLIAYAFAKGWVGELEVTLFSAEVSAAFLLAGLNTAPEPDMAALEKAFADRERLAGDIGKSVAGELSRSASSANRRSR